MGYKIVSGKQRDFDLKSTFQHDTDTRREVQKTTQIYKNVLMMVMICPMINKVEAA